MKNKLISITIILLAAIMLSSCASKDKPPRERSETFIADINSFSVDTFHLYAGLNVGKPKIYDFDVTFAPKNNYVYIKTRIGVDVIRIGFSYEDRVLINEAVQQYLEDYKNGTIPRAKPTKKNAYNKGTLLLEWGGAGLAHKVVASFLTNAEFLEPSKPYFRLLLNATEENGREQIYSPKTYIYISPSQWQAIYDACNQEHLVDMTDEILAEANAF